MDSADVINLSQIITLTDKMPEEHKALRLQTCRFINEVTEMLVECKEADIAPVAMKLFEYVLKGFADFRITIGVSAKCFRKLTEALPNIFAPHTSDMINNVLDPQFVAEWEYGEYS
jgi:hypothetical protein